MFDPERDNPKGDGAFWRRVGIVAVVTALAAVAMWPSISGFEAGSDATRACVALRDGWHADRVAPSQADEEAPPGSGAALRVETYYEWQSGSGACVPQGLWSLRCATAADGPGAFGPITGPAGPIGGRTRPRPWPPFRLR